MPVFAGCSRRQLVRLARWGDVIEVRPGEVLIREGHPDYWFLVVLTGSVRLERAGQSVGVLRPGSHFGEVAIIGFRPQTATAIASEPTLLFVLGRRYVLSLAALDASIQHALFPTLPAGGYRELVRDMHEQGRPDWERLGSRRRREGGAPSERARPTGVHLTWAQAIQTLSGADGSKGGPSADSSIERLNRRQRALARVVAVIASCTAVVTVASVYHPPIAVVTPAAAIDVAQDISISGAPVHRLTGRYLLTPVHVDRPNLARTVFDLLSGDAIVRTNDHETQQLDPTVVQHSGRDAFLSSHRHAIEVAERALGIDRRRVRIVIRDRGILGPSAGLVYALAIVDMLDARDLAAGRVVAATGELMDDGTIGPIGFVAIKAQTAHEANAALFLVPWKQVLDPRTIEVAAEGVESLDDAVRFLETGRHASRSR